MTSSLTVKKEKPGPFSSIALGGAACVFTVNFTHPIETIKTRMQISGMLNLSVTIIEQIKIKMNNIANFVF